MGRYIQSDSHDGERMVIGYLQSQSLHLPQSQIRKCIHRVDPCGVRARSAMKNLTQIKDPTMSGTWMA